MATAAKGVSLNIGLINASVRLEGIKEGSAREATQFNEGHSCGNNKYQKLSRKRWCPDCDVEVAYGDVTKLRAIDGGFAPFTGAEVDELKASAMVSDAKRIDVTPHPADAVNNYAQPSGAAYYVYPDVGCSPQAYSAIHDAVKNHPEIAFCTVFSVRKGTEYMARLEIINDVLGIRVLLWPDEVGQPKPVEVTSNDKANGLMDGVVTALLTDFDIANYRNQFKDVLAEAERSRTPGEGGFPLDNVPKQKKNDPTDFLSTLEAYSKTLAKPKRKAKAS